MESDVFTGKEIQSQKPELKKEEEEEERKKRKGRLITAGNPFQKFSTLGASFQRHISSSKIFYTGVLL